MGVKAESNKQHKENALLDTAFELFTKRGITSTTIDEIVKKAGVAKGTFYLYFKDKYDIRDKIISKKTAALLHRAIEETKKQMIENRTDQVIFFISYIIDYLTKNKLLLKVIHKNLSFSLYHKVMEDPHGGNELREIVDEFKQDIMGGICEEDKIDQLLFILLEMTGSVCYSAIMHNEPTSIEEIKPLLLATIRKILD